MNLAICKNSSIMFRKGFIYECDEPFDGMINIHNSNGDPVTTGLNRDDFIFILNSNDTLQQILESNYTIFEYNGSINN